MLLKTLIVAGILAPCAAFHGLSVHGSRSLAKPTRAPVLRAVDPTWLTHTMTSLADADAVAAASDAAQQGDWFAGFVNTIESCIMFFDRVLESASGSKSYGYAIVLFTLVLKAITYPLTYTQLASSTKMQAIQPKVKEVQQKYASNPEVMNREIALLYQQNEINPLSGCLPSLVQIPVFIALYRALLKLAAEDKLNEPFLWLPNLEGPVYGTQTSDWLFKNWNGLEPSLGWHDTLCFLTLPIILVISQSISTKLLQPPQPPNQDPSQAASQQIIQYLPFMIGFFALNVPSGLAVYWIVNNLFSTTATLVIKQQVAQEMGSLAPAAGTMAPPAPEPTRFENFQGSQTFSESRFVDAEEVDGAPSLVESPLRDVEGFGAPEEDVKPKRTTQKKKKSKKSKR